MYKPKKTISEFSYKNLDLSKSRVVLRSCLNVITDDQGVMTDSTRFYESLPLIDELADKAENLVIIGHLGRPSSREKKFSFAGIANELQEQLVLKNIRVELISELDNASIEKIQANNNTKNENKVIFLLENIRFFSGEDSKVPEERSEFAKTLSTLGNTFINDAFADYRESASTHSIAQILPSYIGPVFMKEVTSLLEFHNPKKPFIAVLGGAKLSEKLDALHELASFADKVLVGGAMAYTLLMAKGINVGNSLVEEDKLDVAKDIITKFGDKLVLPVDHVVASSFNEESPVSTIDSQSVPAGMLAVDIGPKTIALFEEFISSAKSILWNGPMGVFEWDHTASGTKKVIEAISANQQAYTLVGGGDSIAAINKFHITGFDNLSTGGGALLSLISYNEFPTLDVILK
jgi:phosphoglycerate kinase